MRSSQKARLSRHSAMLPASFLVMTMALKRGTAGPTSLRQRAASAPPGAMTDAARSLAQMTKRHAEIMLAEELPAREQPDLDRGIGGNVPAVEPGAAHPFIAVRGQTAVHGEVHRQILDQDEARAPAREVEAFERLDLVALDVDREKIDRRRRARIDEDFVERLHRDLDSAFRPRGRDVEVRVERGMYAGEMERHGAPGLARRGAGDRIDLGAPPPLEFGGEGRLRFDQHAGPAALFEMPGLRQILRVVGADLDEIAGARTGEEGFLELVLHVRREHRAHDAHALTGFFRLAG